MKLKYLILILLAVPACREEQHNELHTSDVDLIAAMQDDEIKANLTEGRFTWSASDKISVWTTAGNFQVLSLAEGENTSYAKFTGCLVGENVSMSTCAVYPAGAHSLAEETLTVDLPSQYDLTEDISSVKMPMFAHLEADDTAFFTSMGGIMSFSLTNVPAGVTQIVFESIDKDVSGSFTASITDDIPVLYASEISGCNTITLMIQATSETANLNFYVPLPVGKYNGLRISLLNEADEVLVVKETSKSNTVNRKSIVNMPIIDMTPETLVNRRLYEQMVNEVTGNMNKYAYDEAGNKLLTFAHASDIHPRGTSYQRNTEECIDYCNENSSLLDALLITGDFSNGVQGRLVWWTTEEFECVLPIMNNSIVPLYTLIGNHDDNINITTGRPAVQTGINPANAELYYIDKPEQYNWLIGPYLEKFTLQEADPEVCYYKIDYDEYKIRMIFLDAMDYPMIFEDGYLKYQPGLFFNQTQLEWFYDTLIATPNDYGVIVVSHGPFIPGFERATYAQGADMIPNVINAFKEGSVYEHEWIYSEDSSISTSFKFDFTGYGQGDFICYLAGHIHYRRADKSYFDDQIVITAPALYQADMSEMTRKGSSLDRYRDTTTINSFNLMSVDKASRKIYLTSYGAYEDETANILNRTEEISY